MDRNLINLERDRQTFAKLSEVCRKVMAADDGNTGWLAKKLRNHFGKVGKRGFNGFNRFIEDAELIQTLQLIDEMEAQGTAECLELDLGRNLAILNSNLPMADEAVGHLVTGDRHYNILFVRGANPDGFEGGNHFVAARIFYGPNGELVVLHRDSISGQVSEEFRKTIKKQFGGVKIINIENQAGIMQQGVDMSCGLHALTAMANGGPFDRIQEGLGELKTVDELVKTGGIRLSVTSTADRNLSSRVSPGKKFDNPDSWKNVNPALVKNCRSILEEEKSDSSGKTCSTTEAEVLFAMLAVRARELGLSLGEVGLDAEGNVIDREKTNFAIADYRHHLENDIMIKQLSNGGSFNLMFRLDGAEDHFISVRVFINANGKPVVLYRDPQNGEIADEFREFISRELEAYGEPEIINVGAAAGAGRSRESKSPMAANMEALAALGVDGQLANIQRQMTELSVVEELKNNRRELENCKKANRDLDKRLMTGFEVKERTPILVK
ncbi:MAG: hypothetical protein LBU15_00605 [Rickettsiales bacterium]|jgi:hypothetical protein|nr:hypothetical protein [Rickettsiales bacterium]